MAEASTLLPALTCGFAWQPPSRSPGRAPGAGLGPAPQGRRLGWALAVSSCHRAQLAGTPPAPRPVSGAPGAGRASSLAAPVWPVCLCPQPQAMGTGCRGVTGWGSPQASAGCLRGRSRCGTSTLAPHLPQLGPSLHAWLILLPACPPLWASPGLVAHPAAARLPWQPLGDHGLSSTDWHGLVQHHRLRPRFPAASRARGLSRAPSHKACGASRCSLVLPQGWVRRRCHRCCRLRWEPGDRCERDGWGVPEGWRWARRCQCRGRGQVLVSGAAGAGVSLTLSLCCRSRRRRGAGSRWGWRRRARVAAAAPPAPGTRCPGTWPSTSAPSAPKRPPAMGRCWTPPRGPSSGLQVGLAAGTMPGVSCPGGRQLGMWRGGGPCEPSWWALLQQLPPSCRGEPGDPWGRGDCAPSCLCLAAGQTIWLRACWNAHVRWGGLGLCRGRTVMPGRGRCRGTLSGVCPWPQAALAGGGEGQEEPPRDQGGPRAGLGRGWCAGAGAGGLAVPEASRGLWGSCGAMPWGVWGDQCHGGTSVTGSTVLRSGTHE